MKIEQTLWKKLHKQTRKEDSLRTEKAAHRLGFYLVIVFGNFFTIFWYKEVPAYKHKFYLEHGN